MLVPETGRGLLGREVGDIGGRKVVLLNNKVVLDGDGW